jgi:polyhydroxyalkanoate synthesis repressor PhaR
VGTGVRLRTMSEPRVIKKYPNRRLYDTATSKYITLEDVRRLVLDGVQFVVRDAKTDEDITRGVLLQIIAEQEEAGQPIFTIPILTQIIRFYGDAVQGLASEFLQRSLAAFGEQQRLFRRHLDDVMAQDALEAMTDLARQNLALWNDVQGSWFGGGKQQQEQPPEPAVEPASKRKGSRPQR